jgi:hypothetical protein
MRTRVCFIAIMGLCSPLRCVHWHVRSFVQKVMCIYACRRQVVNLCTLFASFIFHNGYGVVCVCQHTYPHTETLIFRMLPVFASFRVLSCVPLPVLLSWLVDVLRFARATTSSCFHVVLTVFVSGCVALLMCAQRRVRLQSLSLHLRQRSPKDMS